MSQEFYLEVEDEEQVEHIYDHPLHLRTPNDIFLPGQKIRVADFSQLFTINKETQQRKSVRQKVQDKLPEHCLITETKLTKLMVDWVIIQDDVEILPDMVKVDEVRIIPRPPLPTFALDERCILRIEEDREKYLNKEATTTFPKGTSTSAKRRAKWVRWLATLPPVGVVAGVRSVYTVVWQNGTTETIPSTELVSYDPSGVNEYWCNSPVTHAPIDNDATNIDLTTWGVVQSMDVDKQLVKVKWISQQGERISEPVIEEMSVYSLFSHETHAEIIPGQTVVRTLENDEVEAGTVIELHDGRARVYWFETLTESHPYLDELTVVDGVDSDDEDDDDYSEEDWEDDVNYESCEDEEEEEDLQHVIRADDDGNSTTMHDVMRAAFLRNQYGYEEEDDSGDCEAPSHEENPTIEEESTEDDMPPPRDESFPHLEKYERFESAPQTPLGHHYLEQTVQLSQGGVGAVGQGQL